jgi:hypothetical protein
MSCVREGPTSRQRIGGRTSVVFPSTTLVRRRIERTTQAHARAFQLAPDSHRAPEALPRHNGLTLIRGSHQQTWRPPQRRLPPQTRSQSREPVIPSYLSASIMLLGYNKKIRCVSIIPGARTRRFRRRVVTPSSPCFSLSAKGLIMTDDAQPCKSPRLLSKSVSVSTQLQLSK